MSETEETPVVPEAPKTKRGWPKGKARGPRKPAPVAPAPPVEPQTPYAPTPTPPPVQTPPAPFDPETEVELCVVEAITSTGMKVGFRCSAFSANQTGYEFVSFPRRRGFKTVRVLKADQLAALSIEAPEQFFAALRPVVPQSQPVARPTLVASETSAPMAYISPIAQQLKDEKANVAKPKQDKYNRPMAEVVGEDGTRQIVGASMV